MTPIAATRKLFRDKLIKLILIGGRSFEFEIMGIEIKDAKTPNPQMTTFLIETSPSK